MAGFKTFLKSGHPPTLFSSFLFFDFSFAIWVMNGAMAPFISEEYNLSPEQKGLMISIPILAGAIFRFPFGVLAQYMGRKNTALIIMGLIMLAMGYGYFFVDSYAEIVILGVLLGVAGASFGIALSLGSGWFPPKHKGLAMGISGAGNSGTVLAVLLAPPLAQYYGWQTVYGFGALFMVIPFFLMLIYAKEPPDIEEQSFKEHTKCLWEADGWIFSLIYIITFGGFIGLSSFLPSYYFDQFGVSKIEAGQLTMFATLMGSAVRMVGGWASDRWGGITTLSVMFVIIIASLFLSSFQFDIVTTTILFMICFAAFGAGNGALFQLVPLRWPTTTAVVGSMIGEIGALGGGMIPYTMGVSKQNSGTFSWGFIAFMILAFLTFIALRFAQLRWTKSWVGKGGKAIFKPEPIAYSESSPVVSKPAFKHSFPNGMNYKNILYPVGGNSELADQATKQAAYLAKISGARLTLLYVEDKSVGLGALTSDSKEWEKVKQEWLDEGKRILENEERKIQKYEVDHVDKVIRRGFVPEEVVAQAQDQHADLIVLASQKKSPLGKLLMGSHTYNIFTKSPCPILRIVR